MSTFKNEVTGVIAPPPDDSDFLESENEQDDGQSFIDGQQDLSEMEAELAAVATPVQSQATSVGRPLHPMPAGKIMQMTHNFSFTYFKHPAPRADILNRDGGREAAGLPLNPSSSARFTTKVNHDGTTHSEPLPASAIAPHISAEANVHWFCVDSELVYLSFFEDWGPLNVAMFYRFCLHLHHLINSAQEESTASAVEAARDLHLILYTTNNPKNKANAALLAAMYAMVCGDVSPADAFHPISTLELMPFRDAGYGRADYYLTIQDILYGVHRAIQERLLDLMTFDLEEYETYEQVQNGDWNWITPNIIAFASPNDKEYVAELRQNNGSGRPVTPGLRRPLNSTFLRTVQYFKSHNVKLVVRLNNPLYDSRVFEREGIEHVDMYFDDGSNPCEEIVRSFIARADEIISKGGAIAVHCKAGLGRTGVLIGAYLAYRHGFSAGESIGFMRIMRPGCVVGPQQHFMYQQVPDWIRWREQDDANTRLEEALQKQKVELLGKRRYVESTVSDSSSGEEGATEAEIEASLGDENQRKNKKQRMYIAAPSTPKREEEKSRDDTIRLAKPTPCVGQPRKSPSPTRKRAAQAQAPATVARMGGNGTLAGSRGRIVSADSIRSSAASSRSLELDTQINTAPIRSDFEVNVDVHLQVNTGEKPTAETTTIEEIRPPSQPSRVLDAAQKFDSQSSLDEAQSQEKRSLSPSRSDKKYLKTNVSPSNNKQSQAQPASIDDGLFVEGWQSPEPPSSFSQRLVNSSPKRSPVKEEPSPGTPTSPSTPTGVQRASPHIRERFGLREAGSNQNTPRSRKEALNGTAVASASGKPSSSGSTESISSNGSVTSRDAMGSSDDLTPSLQPGPLEKIIRSESQQINAAPVIPPSASITAALSSPSKPQPSRVVPSSRRPISRTTSNSSAASSSSQKAGRPISRPVSSMATTRKPSNNTQHNNGVRPGTSTSQSNTATTVQRHASSAANSAGRVAAARERLAQKEAANADLGHRTSVKRPREQGNPQSVTQNGSARAPSRAGHPVIANGTQATHRPALATAPSSAVNGGVRQTSNGGVPRFAMSTAASAAKAAAAAPTNKIQTNTVQSITATNANGPTTNRFATYSRAGPNYSHLNHTTAAQSAHAATLNRLHGRNVHRRRSSMGEADIIM
ncbi:uncharacterized protein FA14DRAFT_160009 [Meira miltonrushii]|uniref:protein-tyrosine-phosphatase n=1 Tax=Meira miltonrushii TaxID=1280837 RepID=A0A316VLD4_9BASI|nr:uncharacterized protein FA14DRAFT_160009 [Meira miltonrushii]PWN38439.1 hypothetical protein FA14DRAFT_160009 [Meira miltonrushii]